MNIEKLKEFYKKMYKIRRFEETLLELFSENKLSGTTHTCIGQESTAVVVMDKLKENDIEIGRASWRERVLDRV